MTTERAQRARGEEVAPRSTSEQKRSEKRFSEQEGACLRFIAPLPPSTNNAYATVNGRRVKTRVAAWFSEYVGDLVVVAKAKTDRVPDPPFSLTLDVWFPDEGRRDISNVVKLLEDAVMRAIGTDDRHVHLLVVRRCGVDRFNARVEVVLEALA